MANIVVIAVSVDAALAFLPAQTELVERSARLVCGVVLYALTIGPLTQTFLPLLAVQGRGSG